MTLASAMGTAVMMHQIPMYDAVRWVAAALDVDVSEARGLVVGARAPVADVADPHTPGGRLRCVDAEAVARLIEHRRSSGATVTPSRDIDVARAPTD